MRSEMYRQLVLQAIVVMGRLHSAEGAYRFIGTEIQFFDGYSLRFSQLAWSLRCAR